MVVASRVSASIALTRNPSFPFERALWALTLLALISPLILFGLFLPVTELDKLMAALGKLASKPQGYLLLLCFIVGPYVHWRLRYHEKLQINDLGLRYTPLLGRWPQRAFSLNWSDIESCELRAPRSGLALAAAELQLRGKRQRYTLKPLQWFPPRISWQEQRQRHRRLRGRDIAEAFANSALGRQLAAHQIAVAMPTSKPAGFDLMAHRESRWAIGGLLVLMSYAFVDTVAVQQRYLDANPWPVMAVLALLATLATITLLWRAKLPAAEAIGVGMLFGLAMGAAAYSGLLRLNQFTDWDGADKVSYVRQTASRFVAEGFPDIDVEALEPFWDQHAASQTYTFRIYRGSLGFWQLDEEPINDAMRAFYKAHDRTD